MLDSVILSSLFLFDPVNLGVEISQNQMFRISSGFCFLILNLWNSYSYISYVLWFAYSYITPYILLIQVKLLYSSKIFKSCSEMSLASERTHAWLLSCLLESFRMLLKLCNLSACFCQSWNWTKTTYFLFLYTLGRKFYSSGLPLSQAKNRCWEVDFFFSDWILELGCGWGQKKFSLA